MRPKETAALVGTAAPRESCAKRASTAAAALSSSGVKKLGSAAAARARR